MKNIVRRFITQNADPNLVNTVSLLFCDVIAAVPVCIEPVPYASFISGSLFFCQIVLSYSCTSRLFQFAQLIEFDRTIQVIGRNVAHVKTNSPSCARFLHKTLNLAISGCSFAEYGKNFCQTEERTCNGARDYFYSLTELFCSILAAVCRRRC